MACVQGIDTDTGQPCGDSERDQLRVIGRADSGLTIWEDQFGGTFALLPGGSAPTRLPNGYANLVRSQIEDQDAQGVGTISPTAAAQLAQDAQQFDLAFRQGQDEFNRTDQRLTQQFGQQLGLSQEELAEGARRFDIGTDIDVQQANEANRIAIATTNAGLRAQQAQLEERIRATDLQDARERENLAFAIRREEVATQADNRTALQNATQIRETISSRIESNRLTRQQMVTQVDGINAQIENNVRQFNSQEEARVEQLNESRRQANLQQLQSVSSEIGELSRNPADIGKLAGFLRSGQGPGALSGAVAAGEDFVTDESLLGLRGLLGVREGLQQGPTQAEANLIEGQFVDRPEFTTPLGVAPEIADLFREIGFDPSGIQGAPSPAAGDLSQFFQPIGAANQISAPSPQAQLPAPGGTTGSAGGAAAPRVGASAQGVPGPQITSGGVPDTQQRSQREIDLLTAIRSPSPNIGINIDPNVDLEQFFEGFRGGGVAAPGNPVIVGDGTGETRELAMTDGAGNLHVIPFDQIPQAQDGGVFATVGGGPANFFDLQRDPNAGMNRGGASSTAQGTLQPTATVGGGPVSFFDLQRNPTAGQSRGVATVGGGLANFFDLQRDPNAGRNRGGAFSTARGALTPDQVINSGNVPGAATRGTTAQSVRQTAQNPLQTMFGPVSAADARSFLTDVQLDTLRRGGFNDPREVSPIRVSAPGTNRFLQDVSASAFGTLGFGPESVFREELARLTPQGVAPGTVRRTR